MAKYICVGMRFMKVRSKNDNYYFLGECNDRLRRVHIPTLGKSFSYEEVVFGEELSSEHLSGSFLLERKVKTELDDFGYVSSYIKGNLSGGDIKRIEKEYNREKKPSKEDRRFTR